MKYTAILLYVLLIIPNMISAQQMHVLPGPSRLEFEDNLYQFKESEELFKETPLAYEAYLKSKKSKKASKTWGFVALGTVVVGGILLSTPSPTHYCDTFCFSDAQVAGVLLYLTIPISAIASWIASINHKTRYRKAARIYNSTKGYGYLDKEKIDLSFGLTQNGIGFVMNF